MRSKICFFAFIVLSSLNVWASDVDDGVYRVEVPLDRLTSRTLIELVESKKNNLGSNIKYGEFIVEEGHAITDSSISCWTWVYRATHRTISHANNRLECRWIYGNNKGLGTFSWRIGEASVSPTIGADDSLSFDIEGSQVSEMIYLLREEQEALESKGLAAKNKSWLYLIQDEDRFPQVQCDFQAEKCRFSFHPKSPTPIHFSVGEGSLLLADVLLNDSLLKNYVDVDFKLSLSDANSRFDLKEAQCELWGMFPERTQFSLNAETSLRCDFKTIANEDGRVMLDLNATTTQRWGNAFQGYQALKLSGSVVRLLYEILRSKAEQNFSHMLFVDDLDIGKVYRGAHLKRFNDQVKYPEIALQCSHEIYQDTFTLMYQKYFPDVYLGRVEYFNCIFKSPISSNYREVLTGGT